MPQIENPVKIYIPPYLGKNTSVISVQLKNTSLLLNDLSGSDQIAVFRHGGGVVFMMEWKVPGSMLALQRPSQCKKWGWMCKYVWEMNRTLRRRQWLP